MTVRPTEELPYTARQSMYYHDCTDPLHPDAEVVMPLPVGYTVAIRLDSNGDVRAASLPALIQLLTSHHKLDEDAFRRTFFLSFRLFSTPLRVLAAFRKRWNEPPPAEIVSDAQRRVWLQHVIHIRTRLAQLILLWLDEYWRPATDSVVIEPLRFFVKNSFVRGVVAKDVSTRILAALDRVEAEADAHIPRLHRAREEAQREGPAPPPLAPVVPFDIVLRAEDDYTLNISVFETAVGRERFAEQLTAVAHGLYRTIDAEGAVAAWSTGVPLFHDLQKFEEDLLFWVVQSILELQTREERVCMMEFWLDVASICVRYRNFSGASAIFGGLVFSPVERLSLTILDLAIPSKEQYRKLNTLFDGANNFSVYRRALFESPFPAVPLLSVFRKDTVSLTEISGPIALTDDPDAEKSLIHVSVFRILEKTIRTMECFLGAYQIDRIPMIQDWIQTQLKVHPVEDSVAKMDALSRALEGRAPHPIQKGQVWLVTLKGNTESGAFTLHPLPEPSAVPTPKLRKNKSIATLLNLRTKSK
ncbi:ras guanine nucleotide exchange factor domain-containing protein [Roridomyces roridus]|uniref:Ras guanine nucleotide exchange factor domain-containing protein n=1 Tax=Roridomyces roridus TaxID=1738132 RepID=A0AAD7CBR8_9AGAR|nr:ras guanine nucleotide exchange factor domain-containing protein [Roridomyces roridus]